MLKNLSDIKSNRAEMKDALSGLLELSRLELTQLKGDDMEALVTTTKKWGNLSQKIDRIGNAYNKLFGALDGEDKESLKKEEFYIDFEKDFADTVSKINEIQNEINQLSGEKYNKYKKELVDIRQSNKRLNTYIGSYTVKKDGVYFDEKK